jgi:hypothetical protein
MDPGQDPLKSSHPHRGLWTIRSVLYQATQLSGSTGHSGVKTHCNGENETYSR